jgi:hypothetical protein
MAAEVENPPVTTEEKQEEAPAAVEAPAVVEAEKEGAPAEEAKEAPAAVKEPAPKKPNVFKQNFEKDVVYLYQFARTTSLPSLSPYVLKVETWLRLTGLKYEVSWKIFFFYKSKYLKYFKSHRVWEKNLKNFTSLWKM